MSDYTNYYIVKKEDISTFNEQLLQLLRITSDGDLISKYERSKLLSIGLATKANGFNIITADGIRYLVENKLIHD